MNLPWSAGRAPAPLKRLRRRLRSARRWSVTAGLFGGAAAVLIPYQGLGLWDAAWAALFGGSAVLAGFRWWDYRRLAQSLPDEKQRLTESGTAALAVEAQQLAGDLAGLVRGKRSAVQFRNSAIADDHRRLDAADAAWNRLLPQLPGTARDSFDDVVHAHRALRDLADRVRSVERSLPVSPPDRRPGLADAHRLMVERFGAGVTAYEDTVGAAALVVAEQSALDGALGAPDLTMTRLTEARERLHGLADGINRMREFHGG